MARSQSVEGTGSKRKERKKERERKKGEKEGEEGKEREERRRCLWAVRSPLAARRSPLASRPDLTPPDNSQRAHPLSPLCSDLQYLHLPLAGCVAGHTSRRASFPPGLQRPNKKRLKSAVAWRNFSGSAVAESP